MHATVLCAKHCAWLWSAASIRSVWLKIIWSPFLLKSYKKKFKVDLKGMFQRVQGQEGQGWQLLAFPLTICSCCSTWDLEATAAPARRMRWLSVKSKRPCTGYLILGSSPATFSLRQLSCQPLCAPASPGMARRDSPAQKKDGGKAGSLN